MEALRSSRRPAKSSYGDVFGGPPKYSAPFAAKSDDYGEIFGGIADSCSIPFLDLPPAAESYDGGGRIDYSEIFGGFKGGDFAVDYEELFNEKRKTAESSASSNGRVRMDATFGHHAEVSDLLPEGASKNYGVSSEKNKFLSTSNLSDDGSKQFNRLYRMTSSGSIEDVISGKTHITELHAVPGYTDMINSCSSQDIRSNNSPNIQTNELANNVSYNGQLNDLEQEKIAPSTSSTDNTKISGGDLRTNLKEYNTRHAASDDDTVNVKHHSRSSSNYSASSGDIPYPDSTYVSISDINLRTRPSKLPPPSRAPPKLANKQENTKSRQIHYSIGASRSHGLHGVAKDSSSRFLDVEVDASSAAAASAAAMKEAMEQAEARLKSAKELMERKRDMQDIRKKLGHKEGAKYDEMKEATASEVENFSSEVRTKKLLPKEGKGMKEYALDGMHKARKVGKVSPDHGKQETYVVTTEESHRMRQGNGFKSSWMYNKSEDVSGEWKTEDQFYELINNEKRFRAVKEASKQEDVEKKAKTTAKVNEEKEICSEKAELANEFKRTLKLNKVDATIERDEIVDNPKACIMTIKEEIWKIPEEIPETCILNKTEDYSSSYHHQNANKKLQASQEALMGGAELQKPDALVEASCGENEVYLESSNNSFRFEEIYHDDKVDWKLQPAKEVCEHGDEEEELSGTYMTSASHESEENMKMFRRTGVQHEIEIEMEVTSGTCVREAEEELVAHEEAYLYENSDYTSGNGQQESCNEENECKLEDSSSVGKSNGVQGPHIPAENDLQTEVDHDGNEVRENFEEVKPALSTIGLGVIERKMNSAKETSWPDYGGAETREAQPELQQNEKKQNANQTPPVVENTVEPGVLGGDHAERENGKFKEGNGVLGLEKAHPHCDAAQEDFQRAADKDIGDVQGSSAQNEELGDAAEEVCRKPRSSSDGAIETLGTVTSENSESGAHKREKMDEKTIEREAAYEKEQARKLEEEKEREREREKDRLAVERATREAHERAIAESRGRAERIAVERVTAEARQRALAESWEKAEKASAEALEKSLAEKALKEAKLRAERAAVERATAEARERAVEKALADRAAADARQRAERLNTMSRDKNRKENEAGDSFRTSDKEDREIKLKSSSFDVLHDIRFKSTGSSGSFQRVSSAHGEVDSPLRCKARLERHQRTVERAAKALAEKNMRDILAQREQAERNRLAEALDADVKRWSTGKEGNLRALLSTLQYILGPESGWQPIPLTDVITAAAVKKAYRKATLCVHPDKLQQRGASIQQKYICEKVFDLLKDAWNRFNSEER